MNSLWLSESKFYTLQKSTKDHLIKTGRALLEFQSDSLVNKLYRSTGVMKPG